MRGTATYESLGERIPIPRDPGESEQFALEVFRVRGRIADFADLDVGTKAPGDDPIVLPPPPDAAYPPSVALVRLALKRWKYVAQRGFLCDATDLLLRAEPSGDAQVHSVTGTLAAFATQIEGGVEFVHDRGGSLQELITKLLDVRQFVALAYGPPPPEVSAHVHRELPVDDPAIGEWNAATLRAIGDVAVTMPPWSRAGMYHQFAPDPLEMLVRRVAGISDRVQI
jgi:hypothetical protein